MHRSEGYGYTSDSVGRHLFTDGPPASAVDADFLTSVQEEIAAVIEGAGLRLFDRNGDLRDQLWSAFLRLRKPFAYTVSTQAEFNALIERAAANQYRFKSAVTSVYFAAGTYACTGATSFLSGGDTWGYIETNSCSQWVCEPGTILSMGAERGYISVNTERASIRNLRIVGDGSNIGTLGATNVIGFDIVAHFVTLFRCSVETRTVTAAGTFYGFYAGTTYRPTVVINGCVVSGVASNGGAGDIGVGIGYCSKVSNCSVTMSSSVAASTVYGYYEDMGLSSCTFSGTVTAASPLYGFHTCSSLSTCSVLQMNMGANAAVLRGFFTCTSMASCYATGFSSDSTGAPSGINTCSAVTGMEISQISTTGQHIVRGAGSCKAVSGLYVHDLTGAGGGTGSVRGVENTDSLSAVLVRDLTQNNGATCYGATGNNGIASLYITSIGGTAGTVNGLQGSTYGAALYTDEAANAGNDWMDSNDAQITNQYSTPALWT